MKTKLNRLLSLMLAVLMVVTMFITPVIATDEGVAPAMQDEIPAMQDEIPAVQEEEPAQTEEPVEEPVVESVEEPAPEVDETPMGEISDGMEADTVASEKSGEETYVAKIGDDGYAFLAEAIADAKNGDVIVLLKDCDEKVTVVQAPDVKITIDGNGKTYTGTITVDGRSKTYTTAGLTIQNVNFVTDEEVVFINLGVSGDNNTRYICNLTVSGCTFTGTDNKAVGIKSYTGGDKNLTITNCTATGMHSLAQLKNVAGVEVSGCNVSGKNGISLGASSDVEISKCEMVLTGYGVRADAIEDGAGATITDCKVEANIPVVIRNAKEDYALTVTGTSSVMTADNPDGLWCAIGIEEYGDTDFGTKPITGNIQVTVQNVSEKSNLSKTSVYGCVASVDGTTYTDLQDAINNAEGKTVCLLGNVTTAETIAVNKSLTLDLNGKTIKNTTDKTWALKIDGNSTMTLKDSSSEATGKIEGYKVISVVQGSQLVMESGKLIATGNEGPGIQIYGSTATMKGGSVESAYGAVLIYSNNDVRGTFTMNGGELKSVESAIYANGTEAWDNVDVTINGGSVESSGGIAVY